MNSSFFEDRPANQRAGARLSALDKLDLDAVSCLGTPSSSFDSGEESEIMLQLFIKPVVLGLDPDEKAYRLAMPGNPTFSHAFP